MSGVSSACWLITIFILILIGLVLSIDLKLKKNLVLYEGKVTHMYLDSVGKVTVGVGHMLPNLLAAEKLAFRNAKGATASKSEIKADWEAVVAKGKGFRASAYKHDKSLVLPEAKIEAQMKAHISSFRSELTSIFPRFSSYSENIRLALFDMIFNLGMTKLKNKFPKFVKAVKSEQWSKAAAESKRKGISRKRNEYVYGLLEGEANKKSTKR